MFKILPLLYEALGQEFNCGNERGSGNYISMVELSLRIKIKTFQVLNTEVIWVSTLNKRKMDIAEHFRKNMNYLFKGLKKPHSTLNPPRNGFTFYQ